MTQSGDFLRAYRGTRDFQFSSALMNLGVAYLENKRHAEALEWLLAAKELRSELAGPESFEVAQCHTNLGVAYEHLGEFDKAETELRAALEIYTRLLGNDCDQVVRALNNLSRTLRKAGRLEESRAAVESALQIGQEIGSSVLGQCLDAAAGVYEAQGQLQQAYLARNKAIAHAFSHGHFADQQEFLPLQIALLERMERPAEAEQLRQALADVLRRQQNRTSSRQESAYA
jgi:tetratricopeptide (TPR) repeat protein